MGEKLYKAEGNGRDREKEDKEKRVVERGRGKRMSE